jgi:hypothetical protein
MRSNTDFPIKGETFADVSWIPGKSTDLWNVKTELRNILAFVTLILISNKSNSCENGRDHEDRLY